MRARLLNLLSLAAALATASGCVTVPAKAGIDAGSTNSPLAPNGTKFSRFMKQQSDKMAALGKPPAAKPDSGAPGAEFFVVMGQGAEKEGDLPKAESLYRKALEAEPKSLIALAAFAHFEDRQNHLESATKYYRKALAKYPNEAGVYNDLALCYQRRGMLGDAAAMLQKATELQPEKPLFHNNLAAVLVEGGEDDDALKELMVSNSESVAHYNLACLLHRRGANELAVQHFRVALTNDPSLEPAQKWLAKLTPPQSAPTPAAAEPETRIARSQHKPTPGQVRQPSRPAEPSAIDVGQADAGTQQIPVAATEVATAQQAAAAAEPEPEVAPLPEPTSSPRVTHAPVISKPTKVVQAPPVERVPPVEQAPSAEATPAVEAPPAAQAATAIPKTQPANAAPVTAATPIVEATPVAASTAPIAASAVAEAAPSTWPAGAPVAQATGQIEPAAQDESPETTVPFGRTPPDQATANNAGVIGQLAQQQTGLSGFAADTSGAASETTPADEMVERMPPPEPTMDTIRLGQPEIGFAPSRSESPDGFETLPSTPFPDALARRSSSKPKSLPGEIEPLPALDSAGISGK